MTALALMIGPTADGWAVYLTDGREVARYRGIGAKRRALRHARRGRGDPPSPNGPRFWLRARATRV